MTVLLHQIPWRLVPKDCFSFGPGYNNGGSLVLFMIAVYVQLCKCNSEIVNNMIQNYSRQGYYCSEILHTLFTLHRVVISLRQLHRILQRRDLYRKGNDSNVNNVMEFIDTELNGSGSEIGNRQMYQRCIQGGLRVTRKTGATII